MSVEVGQQAPDFEVKNQFGQLVSLSSFRGVKNVVLVFYPVAFTGFCTAELCAIRDEREVFENDDVQVLGISCDPVASLKVFAEQEKYEFPLLSDFWPHGAVSKQYDAFLETKGISHRATFIIDKAGIIRWSVLNHPGDVRNTAEYREALASL
jgi:peroxiredoxin